MNSKENIKYIVCGVQFNHSFKVLDYWGEIADQLLYKSKYFDTSFFDNISTQYTTERSLSNSKTGDYLKLTHNQLIFKYSIQKDFKKEYEEFGKKINEYLVPNILSEYSLISRRIGIVFCNSLEECEIRKFANKYFKPEISNVTDFRFSKRETAKEALLWRGTNNYINKIFTVGSVIEDGTTGILYDYQLYFDPGQPELREKSNKFLIEALKSFRKDIIEVLN